MRDLVCTVGTSLLTNRSDERPWQWKRGEEFPNESLVRQWLTSADLNRASAETHTLTALDLQPQDRIFFLHSDTEDGRYCARILKGFFEGRVQWTSAVEIGNLGFGARKFSAGLKGLVNRVVEIVRDSEVKGRIPIFCATGGFKAEIALMNLMGALLQIEVVYIHELHEDLVVLPRLPIVWNVEIALRHQQFFEWIEDAPRSTRDVESWLKAAPELRSLVEESDDGFSYLSPAGLLFFRAAKEKVLQPPMPSWPHADPKTPQEKDLVSRVSHHRPAGWEAFVQRLCCISFISTVRYDPAGLGQVVRILDADNGSIGLCYSNGGMKLPLRVETTARGEAQTAMVAEYLRRLR